MVTPLKIIFFDQHFSTPQGSTGNRSYWFCRTLINSGHEVIIISGSYHGASTGINEPFVNGCREGVVDGIRVIEYDMPYSNKDSFFKRAWIFMKFALRSTFFVLRESCDLVFATSTPLTIGIPGIITRWLKRKPFVFEVRDLWPELPREMGVITNPIILNLMSLLEWISYYSAHRLIGLSPGIVEGIARRGIEKSQIAMIPNGCDLNMFDQNLEPLRPEGVDESDLMVIYTGTHGIANGLNAILDVALELKNRQIKGIKLVLVGDGKLKPELVHRAKNEKLNNVIFLDLMDKHKLTRLMAGADLGIQCLANVPAFYYGTSPNKFFDYIAAGLPVLNNYPGWIADMINTHQCGFAIPPDNAILFADSLEYAANHCDELESMGKAARKLAKSKFDRSMLASGFVKWLENKDIASKL